jgi:hypothetical protein
LYFSCQPYGLFHTLFRDSFASHIGNNLSFIDCQSCITSLTGKD